VRNHVPQAPSPHARLHFDEHWYLKSTGIARLKPKTKETQNVRTLVIDVGSPDLARGPVAQRERLVCGRNPKGFPARSRLLLDLN
jgi:hypothetical protein